MSNIPAWLPDLILLQDFSGDWSKFMDAIYQIFRGDFILTKPKFRGGAIKTKWHPIVDGREATFWHVIQTGKVENERTPDLRRCERVPWIRPVIEHEKEPSIKVWENKRKQEKRICLWLEDYEYLVVLAKRKGYILLWTAYPVTDNQRKRKLQKEYEEFNKG